jgi:hypothetical protein
MSCENKSDIETQVRHDLTHMWTFNKSILLKLSVEKWLPQSGDSSGEGGVGKVCSVVLSDSWVGKINSGVLLPT